MKTNNIKIETIETKLLDAKKVVFEYNLKTTNKNELIIELLSNNLALNNEIKDKQSFIKSNKELIQNNLNLLIVELKKESQQIIKEFQDFYRNNELIVSKKTIFDILFTKYDIKGLSSFKGLIHLISENCTINHALNLSQINFLSDCLKSGLISKTFLKSDIKEIELKIKEIKEIKRLDKIKEAYNKNFNK